MGSIGKIRILDLLSKENELNITAIAKRTKLNHTRVKIHLLELQGWDIIKEKKFGRIKIYTINDELETGHKIKKFLQEWNVFKKTHFDNI